MPKKKKNTFTLYTLWLHWKQGDDFRDHLNSNKTVSNALRSWAKDMIESADHLINLATRFENTSIEAEADTHHISFSPQNAADGKVVVEAVKSGLLNKDELEADE